MEAFVVMIMKTCEDPCYGDQNELIAVCSSFEQAKTMVHKLVEEDTCHNKYTGGYCMSKNHGGYYIDGHHIEILRMQMGDDTNVDSVYTTGEKGREMRKHTSEKPFNIVHLS
jgi:hypothetical protein